MPKRDIIGLHAAFDSSITLGNYDTLSGKHIIQGGNVYGNVIFTEIDPCVLIAGNHVLIEDCLIEGAGYGIDIRR